MQKTRKRTTTDEGKEAYEGEDDTKDSSRELLQEGSFGGGCQRSVPTRVCACVRMSVFLHVCAFKSRTFKCQQFA